MFNIIIDVFCCMNILNKMLNIFYPSSDVLKVKDEQIKDGLLLLLMK
jgi:hypothetical protein